MSDVAKLNEQLKGAQNGQLKFEALLRLKNNPDFRKVILEGFCRDECARYIVMAGDNLLDPEDRKDAKNMAMAAGHLQRFLSIQEVEGAKFKDSIEQVENELVLARQEENL